MKKIYKYIFVGLSTMLALIACQREEDIVVATLSVQNETVTVSHNTATVVCDIQSAATINQVAVNYSTEANLSNSANVNTAYMTLQDDGKYGVTISDLSPTTTYYFCYTIYNSLSAMQSPEQRQFATTDAPSVPSVSVVILSDITANSAAVTAQINDDGGYAVSERGIVYSTAPLPTVANALYVRCGEGAGSFTCTIMDLQPNTRYYVRAYAINEMGIAYGEAAEFTTLTLPTVTTGAVSNITYNSATVAGNVTASGGANVTERGICYSLSGVPTLDNMWASWISAGTGTGAYSCELVNLPAGTIVYVRAYAVNINGVAYGEVKQFTTLNHIPVVQTGEVVSVNSTTATAKGTVLSDGGHAVTARGICYSTTMNPTTADNVVTEGIGVGSFTCTLSNLKSGTKYYIRAFATNTEGTAYGEIKTFTK